jgi:AraC-like DNA-binding protein
VNISASHYFALFKRCTGCAPIDCFIRLRMWRATQLLDSTGLTVKEVAEELGYEDPFYFSRVFKSVHRVAPTQYRSLPPRFKEAIRNSEPLAVISRRATAAQPEDTAAPVVASRASSASSETATLTSRGSRDQRIVHGKK